MLLFTIVALAISAPDRAFQAPILEPVMNEAVINASLDDAWAAFTTGKGLESWCVAHAEVELRIGGKMRTTYSKDGTLGDESTIENTYLSFDPKRMVSFRVTRFPKRFPFPKAVESMWTVIYFEPVSPGKTRVTERTMGFTSDEESQRMRAFFERGNKSTMDALVARFAKKAE